MQMRQIVFYAENYRSRNGEFYDESANAIWDLLGTARNRLYPFFRCTRYVPLAFPGSSNAVGDRTDLVYYRLPDRRCRIAERKL